MQFGLITDRGRVPDPERIVARFGAEFEKLLLLVLMEPWERLEDPAAVEAAIHANDIGARRHPRLNNDRRSAVPAPSAGSLLKSYFSPRGFSSIFFEK